MDEPELNALGRSRRDEFLSYAPVFRIDFRAIPTPNGELFHAFIAVADAWAMEGLAEHPAFCGRVSKSQLCFAVRLMK